MKPRAARCSDSFLAAPRSAPRHATATRSERWRWGAAVASGLLLALWPSAAEAHLVTTGLGPVYDGLSHLALTPEDVIPVLALGLFAGLRGASHGRAALFALPAAWLAGGLAGLARPHGVSPAWTTASLLVLGGLVAADLRLSRLATAALAGLVGLFHGFLNGEAMATPGPGGLGLLGIIAALFVLIALASALVVSLRAPWARVAVRVAGSWIVAMGLFMLGWALHA